MSTDWPSAVTRAREAGDEILRRSAAQGLPDSMGGSLAALAALVSFHRPTGRPDGGTRCMTCPDAHGYPCPAIDVAGEYDPGIAVVLAALRAPGGDG